MSGRHIEVYIAVPSLEEGSLIARALVESRLAAKVDLVPMNSFYYWEENLCEDSEVLLLVKTKDYLFKNHLIPAVKAMHSYEVTEILALPIVMGDQAFLDWVDSYVKSEADL